MRSPYHNLPEKAQAGHIQWSNLADDDDDVEGSVWPCSFLPGVSSSLLSGEYQYPGNLRPAPEHPQRSGIFPSIPTQPAVHFTSTQFIEQVYGFHDLGRSIPWWTSQSISQCFYLLIMTHMDADLQSLLMSWPKVSDAFISIFQEVHPNWFELIHKSNHFVTAPTPPQVDICSTLTYNAFWQDLRLVLTNSYQCRAPTNIR